MIVPLPIKAPGMTPPEMSAIKRRKDFVAEGLVVVGAKPGETVVECNVPRIAETAGKNLEILAIVIATKHTAGESPIISRMMVSPLVFTFFEMNRRGQVRKARSSDAPQVT